jgi:hypothetical protein
MIFFSGALVVSPGFSKEGWLPLIGFDNLVTISAIDADFETTDNPASNLGNYQTSSVWKAGSTADGYLTFTLTGDTKSNYIAVARHNWGSGLVLTTVEAITAEPGAVWEVVVAALYLGSDAPEMLVFEDDFYVGVRFKLEPAAVEPQAAVIYVGEALRLPKGIPPGHVPIVDAREREAIRGDAQNGDFLGSITVSERLATTLDLEDLPGDWYRENLRPVIQGDRPFFFAWSPVAHPDEVGFCEITNSPKPVISQETGEMNVSLALAGLAL